MASLAAVATDKLVPIPVSRPELRALAAGEPTPAAVKKRLETAARAARRVEQREPPVEEKADRPTQKPPK